MVDIDVNPANEGILNVASMRVGEYPELLYCEKHIDLENCNLKNMGTINHPHY